MKVYVVRNKEGKYLRSKGQYSNRKSWVDSLDEARIYPKIGQAKARVTFFYTSYPDYGCPEILEFDLDNPKVIDYEQDILKKEKYVREIERNRKAQRYLTF